MAKVSEVEPLGLNLEHAQYVAPLPVRDATSLSVPVELAQDQVFRARHEDAAARSLQRRRETAPFELRAVDRRIARHEEVHFNTIGWWIALNEARRSTACLMAPSST